MLFNMARCERRIPMGAPVEPDENWIVATCSGLGSTGSRTARGEEAPPTSDARMSAPSGGTTEGPSASRASDTVVLLDLAQGRIVGQLRPHLEHPYHVGFDSRGGRLVSCSTDKTIAVSDVRPLRERLRVRDAALGTAGR
jgi:hypothetical protein